MVNLRTILNAMGEDGALKDYYAVSLSRDKIDQFHLRLDTPKLEILLLNLGSCLDLSCVSFEGMKGLKVLAVTNGYHDGVSFGIIATDISVVGKSSNSEIGRRGVR